MSCENSLLKPVCAAILLALGAHVPAALASAGVELSVDALQLAKAASAPASTKRLQYAVPVATNVSLLNGVPSVGQWQDLGNGWSLWKFPVKSAGAYSLDFGFSALNLTKSAVLNVQSRVKPADAFTISERMLPADRGEFWTAMVSGDTADFELWVPTSERHKARLHLTTTHHAFIDVGKAMSKSGSCNLDTACPAGLQVAPQTRAVARYTNGGGLCTGALVANSGPERLEPYFLTANHCITTATQARQMVLYWGYESSACRSGDASGMPISVSRRRAIQMGGARLVSSNAQSDFSLVRLNNPVPVEANAFWSGWSTDMGPRGAYVIHHPSGHEKRVSFVESPLHPWYYGSSTVAGSHFHVPYYSAGTTEPGSSGAPLFDASGRIIGQLHGGPASCAAAGQGYTASSSDYYGALRASYQGGGTADSRLSD